MQLHLPPTPISPNAKITHRTHRSADPKWPQVASLEAEAREPTPVKTLADLSSIADPWATQPSVGTLLPDIIELWHATAAPLLARAQFLVAHQGKEAFYYMAEHAHLLELQRCVALCEGLFG